ncbi:MAG: hypothetical protein ACREEB_12355 [Caulobacteraceae bacterium]
MSRKLIAVMSAMTVLAAAPAVAGTVYSNPSDGFACSSCWTSTNGTDGTGGYQAYDDFTLGASSAIRTVTWTGFYIDDTFLSNPVAPPTTSWQIAFYANSSGEPGTALYSTTLPTADVTATFLGDVPAFDASVSFYQFSAVLSSAFDASGGTTYWFSPTSVQATFNPFFSWSASDVSDPYGTWQMGLGTVGEGVSLYKAGNVARAFSLSTSVPESASWALMILGIAGAGAAMRATQRRVSPARVRVRPSPAETRGSNKF